MPVARINSKNSPIEKRRINISSKRQITIPAKFFKALDLDKEIECIYSNGMLILKPVKQDDSAFAEEILEDLIQQGYSGQKLISEFKKVNLMIRPAVDRLIEEADEIAKAATIDFKDSTDDIFGDEELED